jgi:hypothetical protein
MTLSVGRGRIDGVRSGLGALVAIAVASAGAARAERREPRPVEIKPGKPAKPAKLERSYTEQIEDRLTWLGDEMGHHLGALSMDHMEFRFDGKSRRARIGLGKGDGDMLSMRIASDVKFERGLARVATRINLTLNGTKLLLQLPDVEVVPRGLGGDFEVRIPLLEGTFEPERWLGLE